MIRAKFTAGQTGSRLVGRTILFVGWTGGNYNHYKSDPIQISHEVGVALRVFLSWDV